MSKKVEKRLSEKPSLVGLSNSTRTKIDDLPKLSKRKSNIEGHDFGALQEGPMKGGFQEILD